ncbi:hypothetical protein [Dactylosporangium sp. NPDC000521]|uniref:hypothetical protein n=1 Tax=Dactylosporangium sp. NPDC000521 TaxID=3363975 RepID=UPI0036A0B067
MQVCYLVSAAESVEDIGDCPPMRGLRTDRTAQTMTAGHAFMQNLRRGHYELGIDARRGLRVAAAFTELATAI